MQQKLELNHIVQSFEESHFSIVTKLAMEHKAINLAQGFPDFDGPQWVIDLAAAALNQNKNQYSPSLGILPLREAISGQYQDFYELFYDPKSEVLVTNGATEAIYATIMALINPGDEVIIFEPFYDSYLASLKMAKADIKFFPLEVPHFAFDPKNLENLITPKTKLLILNSPHNPTGKVFSLSELSAIAMLAQKHNFYILSDEVYEFITFDKPHIPIASLPGMKERVITISSIGKTLSLTGWKIGWALAPTHLLKAIHHVHQFITFCVATPLQVAIAQTLPKLNTYLVDLKNSYRMKRDYLVNGLTKLHFEVLEPSGTYFLLAKTQKNMTDEALMKKLILGKRVAVIPLSGFYKNSLENKQYVRFCFAKKEETLKLALDNLSMQATLSPK